MIRDHYLAVRNLIPTDPTFTVHFGAVQQKRDASGKVLPLTYPYVLVWGDLGTEGSESLNDRVDHLQLRPRITYVGSGFDQCLFVAQKVRDALNRARPIVQGWSCSKLRQEPLMPSDVDRDVTVVDASGRSFNPVYAVDEYPFTSYPA